MTRQEHDLDLIQRYFAGDLDAAAERAFWDAVASDESFARRVTAYSMLESQLIERRSLVTPSSLPATARRTNPVLRRIGERRSLALSIAAALLLSAAAVAIYVFAISRPHSSVPSGPSIATLIDATGMVTIDGRIGNAGQQYPAGAVVIDSGSAEFQLRSGASVRLRGRTRLAVVDDMNASMGAGVATFRCPPRAVGFTVHLPGGARVVDLGTAFTVWVDPDGRSSVYLHEGSVELRGTDGSTHTLNGHLAYAADADGRSIEPIDPADAPDLVAFDPAWVDPAGAAYAAAVLADAPAVYWRFDRVHDSRVVDQTGNGHDATLDREAELSDGRFDAALKLAGAGFAECDDVRRLMVTDTYTVECWARADRVQTGAIFSLGDAVLLEFTPRAAYGKEGPSIRYLHRPVGSAAGGLSVFHPYRADRWIHIVAVKTADTMTLYIDGEPVESAEIADPLVEPAPSFTIGRLSTKPTDHAQARMLRGSIDEVAVYQHALTAQQIRSHFRAAQPEETRTENAPVPEGDHP